MPSLIQWFFSEIRCLIGFLFILKPMSIHRRLATFVFRRIRPGQRKVKRDSENESTASLEKGHHEPESCYRPSAACGAHWHSARLRRHARQATNYTSERIFGPTTFGQWTQLALVYDRQQKRVSHYVNGQAVASHAFRFDVRLRLQFAEIGNWTVSDLGDRQGERIKLPLSSQCP